MMEPLLWLLLPVAAASGWWIARSSRKLLQQDCPPGINRQYIQGFNYLLNEQPDKAIEALINVLDTDHETVETHLVLGALFRRRGEVDRAIRIHQNIIARPNLDQQQRNQALLELGTDYLKAGVLDRAENIFNKMLDIQSKNPKVYKQLREIFEQEKEWQKAIEMTQQIIRLGDKQQSTVLAQYYCELAALKIPDNREQVQQYLKNAISADKTCVRAHIMMGDNHVAEKNIRQAIKSYLRVLDINRSFAPLIFNKLAYVYNAENDPERFIRFLEKQGSEQKAANRLALLQAYQDAGDKNEVRALLESELTRKDASPKLIKRYLEMMRDQSEGDIKNIFSALYHLLDHELSNYKAYGCKHCGFESNTLFWQCPTCKNWDTVRPGRFYNPQLDEPGK